MSWLKRFHEDHMAVVRLLAKLEGNLKDIEYDEAGENAIWDLKEFGDLLKKVVIPHFKEEEKTTYPRAAAVDEEGRQFISGMYGEHKDLYEAFEGFFRALGEEFERAEAAGPKDRLSTIAMSGNIDKMEAPKNIEKLVQVRTLGERLNKEEVLKYGYKIVQLLREHIEKEETTVAELVKKAGEDAGRV
ncbi:MAG: hemerythrin domain-containing protein [Peptococcaceae bacterium]|nr:hemerythrin domain-containing protein [Peptococcaceae bacterium]